MPPYEWNMVVCGGIWKIYPIYPHMVLEFLVNGHMSVLKGAISLRRPHA